MLLRFTLPITHVSTLRAMGLFQGTYWLHETGRLDQGETVWLFDELDWFGQHLPAPWYVNPRAVFWYRETSGEAIAHMWSLARIVEGAGWPVHVHRTHRPGLVVYHDDYPVAAIPYRDTFVH
jgi:hypothetical protein